MKLHCDDDPALRLPCGPDRARRQAHRVESRSAGLVLVARVRRDAQGSRATKSWTGLWSDAEQAEGDRLGKTVIPEFRDGLFDERAPVVFGRGPSPVPGMRATSHDILAWETAGIEHTTVVLFWMPFELHDESDPRSLPGFTTRAEVSRELQRNASRLVLGMPAGALSSSHIRFHAHHAGLVVHPTLEATLTAAWVRLE